MQFRGVQNEKKNKKKQDVQIIEIWVVYIITISKFHFDIFDINLWCKNFECRREVEITT